MSKGGGSPSTVTSTGKTEPWTVQQPYLEDIFTSAKNLAKSGGPLYYDKPTYAAATDDQLGALSNIGSLAHYGLENNQSTTNRALQALKYDFLSPNFGVSSNIPGLDVLEYNAGHNYGIDSPGMALLSQEANNDIYNPAYGMLDYQQGRNPVLDATGIDFQTLQSLGAANPATGSPGSFFQSDLLAKNPYLYTSSSDLLPYYARTNMGLGDYNAGSATLTGLSSDNLAALNPANDTLNFFASGDRAKAGNPYISDLVDSIKASVLPGIQSQFISGGMLSSPEAARASAAGVTAALADPLFRQYQQEAQNQLSAAGQLSSGFLGGKALQGTFARDLAGNILQGGSLGERAATDNASAFLSGTGLQNAAAGNLNSNYLGGAGLQQSALDTAIKNYLAGNSQALNASNLYGSLWMQGAGLSQNAATTIGDQLIRGQQASTAAANAWGDQFLKGTQQELGALGLAPTLMQMPYQEMTQLYSSGAAQQQLDQQAINDAVQKWNYIQTQPWNTLNQYVGQVTGNYGGTTTLTQPYFTNSGSNKLGGALGGASLGNMIFPAASGGLGLGALGGAALGALI